MPPRSRQGGTTGRGPGCSPGLAAAAGMSALSCWPRPTLLCLTQATCASPLHPLMIAPSAVLELNELAGHVGGAAGEMLMDDCAAKVCICMGRLVGCVWQPVYVQANRVPPPVWQPRNPPSKLPALVNPHPLPSRRSHPSAASALPGGPLRVCGALAACRRQASRGGGAFHPRRRPLQARRQVGGSSRGMLQGVG